MATPEDKKKELNDLLTVLETADTLKGEEPDRGPGKDHKLGADELAKAFWEQSSPERQEQMRKLVDTFRQAPDSKQGQDAKAKVEGSLSGTTKQIIVSLTRAQAAAESDKASEQERAQRAQENNAANAQHKSEEMAARAKSLADIEAGMPDHIKNDPKLKKEILSRVRPEPIFQPAAKPEIPTQAEKEIRAIQDKLGAYKVEDIAVPKLGDLEKVLGLPATPEKAPALDPKQRRI